MLDELSELLRSDTAVYAAAAGLAFAVLICVALMDHLGGRRRKASRPGGAGGRALPPTRRIPSGRASRARRSIPRA